MAIVVLWASPNKDGLTAATKDKILEGISKAGGEIEVVHLNKSNIKLCLTCGDGWGTCRSEGRCIIPDDFAEVYDKLVTANGIVFITPVYWHDIAECLKAFLDRLRRCETAYNHHLKGKKCLLIACAGGTGLGVTQCLNHLEDILSHMKMIATDRLPITRFNKIYDLPVLSCAGELFASHLIKK
jgi:multimeric flavodoxin WrbA